MLSCEPDIKNFFMKNIRITLFLLLFAVVFNGYAKFSYVYGKDPDMTPVDTSYIDVVFRSYGYHPEKDKIV